MATTVNDRDTVIMGGTRTQAVTLPSDVNVSGNVTGTLNGIPVQDVIDAANSPATANYFTTSSSDPAGGSNGDAHYNSSTNVMWFKVGGAWQKGGTINASQITTGTLAAARIAASSITSDKLSVSSLSAIAANLGTVTAGTISGSSNIEITGRGAFKGMGLTEGQNASLVANPTSASGGFGLWAGASSSGYSGVLGSGSSAANGVTGTASGSGRGVTAIHTGSGTALGVIGKMTITDTTLVSNLNAQLWNSATLQMNAAAGSSTATFNNTTKPGTNSGGNGWMIITYGGTKYAIPTWVVTP